MPTFKILADNKENLTWENKREAEQKYFGATSGLYNSYIYEPHPIYLQYDKSEKVIETRNNSFIIMGRDRPAGMDSGYGGQGQTQAACIDIIAGMSGQMARTAVPGSRPLRKVGTNKNVEYDAARIYISQKTDIDKNFGLSDGYINDVETHRGKSGIGIKADCVRIMARDGGIKLVTGLDVYNSPGGKTTFIGGIDLIAGNDDTELQPLAMGGYLQEFLVDFVDKVEDLSGLMLNFMSVYTNLIIALQSHEHPPAIPGAPILPSMTFNSFSMLNHWPDVIDIYFDIWNYQMETFKLKQNYLYDTSGAYILSKFNNTN